jgi:hypothetical protein
VSENNNKTVLRHIVLPLIFLIVTLLGGLRLSIENNTFIFLKPALVCLILATILLVLLCRSNFIRLSELFSENFLLLQNIANGIILMTLFTASAQIFNSLLPENGIAFWIVGFFFFWTLWNNLFIDFKAKKLIQSLASLFGLAFVVKYLILASLTSTEKATWTQKIVEGLMKEASFGLLDLPQFSAATGYIQFFALMLYSIGLLLLSSSVFVAKDSAEDSKSI